MYRNKRSTILWNANAFSVDELFMSEAKFVELQTFMSTQDFTIRTYILKILSESDTPSGDSTWKRPGQEKFQFFLLWRFILMFNANFKFCTLAHS